MIPVGDCAISVVSRPPGSIQLKEKQTTLISLEDGTNSVISEPAFSEPPNSKTLILLGDGANSLISEPVLQPRISKTLIPLGDGANSVISEPPGSIQLEVKNGDFARGWSKFGAFGATWIDRARGQKL